MVSLDKVCLIGMVCVHWYDVSQWDKACLICMVSLDKVCLIGEVRVIGMVGCASLAKGVPHRSSRLLARPGRRSEIQTPAIPDDYAKEGSRQQSTMYRRRHDTR